MGAGMTDPSPANTEALHEQRDWLLVTLSSIGDVVRLPLIQPPHERPPSSERPLAKALSGCRVLVVDDNQDSADMGMLLRLKGNDVRTAHDGLEAVEVAGTFRPELVLLDIGLPKLNGYDVARQIRQQPWGRDVVLVAQTG
jgi:PleD family two-component response regulator